MMRTLATGVVATLLIASCGPSSTGGKSGLIEVQPANATITMGTTAGAPIDYVAIGHFADGHTEMLDDATFAIDPDVQALGTLSAAEFTASGMAAGTGTVSATSGMITGSTGVSVIVHQTHLDPMAPPGSDGNFPDQPGPGTNAPTIDYPLDGAIMPITAAAPDVQWEGTANTGDLFRVGLSPASRPSTRSSRSRELHARLASGRRRLDAADGERARPADHRPRRSLGRRHRRATRPGCQREGDQRAGHRRHLSTGTSAKARCSGSTARAVRSRSRAAAAVERQRQSRRFRQPLRRVSRRQPRRSLPRRRAVGRWLARRRVRS